MAPLGNQAANRDEQLHPEVWGAPGLLEKSRQKEVAQYQGGFWETGLVNFLHAEVVPKENPLP